tara:strand:- start:184 stop:2187 length:2004 start_codon:yes stop_codon:yes gene_type:complete
MFKNAPKVNFHKIEKLFLAFFLILIIYQFSSYYIFTNELNNHDNKVEDCSYFLPFVINNFDNYEIIKQNKDIYVFPEIKNILCLGKIVNYEIQNNILYVDIGTNSKFINLLILSSQVVLFFLYSFILRKENYKIINFLAISFIFINYIQSLNVISYFYFLIFPVIFLYINNSLDYINISSDKNFSLSLDIVFIIFLFVSFCIVQFSSHQYETIDWDINAYLVTSQDIGRGNLPLENQFENKPPLLFLLYFLFSLIAKGNLLPIKILNDLILFLSVITLYFIIKNKDKFRFEAFSGALLFILLTSNYWFHPGFSEIYSLFFLSICYLNLIKTKNKYKFFISGLLFSFSTLVNIGSAIFLIGFTFIIFMISNRRFSKIIQFYIGLIIVHLLVLAFYFLNGLANEYLISTLFIPISYSQTEISIFSELVTFLTSLFEYNFFVCILLFVTAINNVAILIKNFFNNEEVFKDSSTYTSILFLNSCLFYYAAAKGYYHHLFFILFFVTFGIITIPKSNYKILIYIAVLISSFQIFSFYIPQTITNLKNINELENNYPVSKVSDVIIDKSIDNDVIFSTDNILLLYYLDKPNSSYIVHPALYNYQEISIVLEKYKKIQINELTYQLRRLPKLIEGDITDDIKNKYQKLDTETFLSGNIDFFDREKTIEIFIRKD